MYGKFHLLNYGKKDADLIHPQSLFFYFIE